MQIKNKQTIKQTINYKQKQINKVSNQRNENNQKTKTIVFVFSVKLIWNCNRINVKAGITHLLNSLTHYVRLKIRLIGHLKAKPLWPPKFSRILFLIRLPYYYQKNRVGALNNLVFLYELTAEFFSLNIFPNKVCEVFGVFDDSKKDCLKRVMSEVFMRFRRKSYLSKPRWRSCKHTQRQRKELVK